MTIVVHKYSPPDSKSESHSTVDDQAKDRMLAQMIEMGFPHDQSLQALSSTGYDLNSACSLLAQPSIDVIAQTEATSNLAKKHKG